MKRTTLFTGLAALLIAACHRPPQASPQGMPTPVVTVAVPVQKTVSEWDEFTARVDAVESSRFARASPGILPKCPSNPGSS